MPAASTSPDSKRDTRRLRARIALTLLLVALVAGVVAVVFLTQIVNQDPIPLGAPSGELAFTGNRDGTWDVFVMDASGVISNLTNDDVADADEYFPSWFFGGTMINFLTDRSGEMGPGQVRPDGSEFQTLSILQGVQQTFASGRIDWDPAWSPDGSQLLWSSLRDFNLELYLMDFPSNENLRRLSPDGFVPNGPRDWFAAWSPDGTQFLYSTDRNGLGVNEDIYLYDLASGESTRLTDNPANDFHPMWTLDGSQIVFVSERDVQLVDGEIGLYVMDLDGGNQRRLPADAIVQMDPTYSADGAQVVYVSNEDGPWHLFIMDADGENVRRLTEGDDDYLFPVWRPQQAGSEAEATPEPGG